MYRTVRTSECNWVGVGEVFRTGDPQSTVDFKLGHIKYWGIKTEVEIPIALGWKAINAHLCKCACAHSNMRPVSHLGIPPITNLLISVGRSDWSVLHSCSAWGSNANVKAIHLSVDTCSAVGEFIWDTFKEEKNGVYLHMSGELQSDPGKVWAQRSLDLIFACTRGEWYLH